MSREDYTPVGLGTKNNIDISVDDDYETEPDQEIIQKLSNKDYTQYGNRRISINLSNDEDSTMPPTTPKLSVLSKKNP